jgi:hypothetical protein
VKLTALFFFLSLALSASAQEQPTEVAPGVRLTSDGLVWLVYDSAGKTVAISLPHHDADIQSNDASNIARSAVFVKQKKAVILPGAKSDTRIKATTPTLFVQLTAAEEKELSRSNPSKRPSYAIIRLQSANNLRLVGQFEYSRFKGKPQYAQNIVPCTQERFGSSDWLRVFPSKPLSPGEYALVQIQPRIDEYSPWVFDFAVE